MQTGKAFSGERSAFVAASLLAALTGCTTIRVTTPEGVEVRYSSSKDIEIERLASGAFTIRASASTPAAAFADAAIKLFNAGIAAAK